MLLLLWPIIICPYPCPKRVAICMEMNFHFRRVFCGTLRPQNCQLFDLCLDHLGADSKLQLLQYTLNLIYATIFSAFGFD
jgi:hypothetical protein